MTRPATPSGQAFDQAETPAAALAGEALQVEIAQLLTGLHELVPHVTSLVDSYQRSLGFLGPEAIAEQDAAVRTERRDQAKAIRQGRPRGHGATPAPGNFQGISVDVDLWYTALHVLRRLDQWHHREHTPGHKPLVLPEPAHTRWLLDQIRPLVWECTRDQLLRVVLDELRHCRDNAENLLHGEDRLFLGDCPSCNRPTLVAHFDQGLIRCGKDQTTGHYHPCVCADPLCNCKSKPVSHRHTWWNHRGHHADGWHALANRIRLDRLAHPTH